MNDIDTRIEQCATNINLLECELKRLETLRDEANKTKLRHGDYGFYHGILTDPCVVYEDDGDFYVVNQCGNCGFELTTYDIEHFVVRGNIFDELREIANGQ